IVGGRALTVLTGSMEPALPVGSVVIERSGDVADLHVGDVATYQQSGSGNLVTHRIVAIDASHSRFTFRGDANPVPDPQQVPVTAIRGVVWFDVPLVGTLRERIGSGGSNLALGAAVLLGCYSAWQFAAAFRERRRRA
ncbi:MAG: signal peptidase I, partial [Jatrophihabitantaceae bacterium]